MLNPGQFQNCFRSINNEEGKLKLFLVVKETEQMFLNCFKKECQNYSVLKICNSKFEKLDFIELFCATFFHTFTLELKQGYRIIWKSWFIQSVPKTILKILPKSSSQIKSIHDIDQEVSVNLFFNVHFIIFVNLHSFSIIS